MVRQIYTCPTAVLWMQQEIMSNNTSLNSLLDIVWLQMHSILWSWYRPATSMVRILSHTFTTIYKPLAVNNHICSVSAFKTWHRLQINRLYVIHQYKICNDDIILVKILYISASWLYPGVEEGHQNDHILDIIAAWDIVRMVWHNKKQKVQLVKCAFLKTETLHETKSHLVWMVFKAQGCMGQSGNETGSVACWWSFIYYHQ